MIGKDFTSGDTDYTKRQYEFMFLWVWIKKKSSLTKPF